MKAILYKHEYKCNRKTAFYCVITMGDNPDDGVNAEEFVSKNYKKADEALERAKEVLKLFKIIDYKEE